MADGAQPDTGPGASTQDHGTTPVSGHIASLISTADAGDPSAAQELFAALYAELHRMARREIARRGPVEGLGVTTLLHEAYVDVAGRSSVSFPDRARFMAYAARVMRGIIIDHARERRAAKRGGLFVLTSLGTDPPEVLANPQELTAIADALDGLATVEPLLAETVELKFFCGFSLGEIAAMRGVSERTVQRQWEQARIYLHRVLRDPEPLS